MSIFHETMREILEDVQKFLNVTLHNEHHLLAATISHKESLLIKIHHLRTEYPQLHLQLIGEGTKRKLGSPPPYIDMQGSQNTEYVYSDSNIEEDYEACDVAPNEDPKCSKGASELDSASEGKDPYGTCSSASLLKGVIKCGYLEKKGKGGWLNMSQRRWVAVKDNCLLLFNKSGDKRPCGYLNLNGYDVRPVSLPNKDENRNSYFELVGPGKKTYQFVSVHPNETKDWIDAVQKAILNEKSNLAGSASTTGQVYSDGSQGSSGDGSCEMKSSQRGSIHEKDTCKIDDMYEVVEENVLSMSASNSNDAEDLYHDTDGDVNSSSSRYVTGMLNGKTLNHLDFYVGLWDCKSNLPDELDFRRGDIIRIVSKKFDEYHWWIGELNGIMGLVPKQYLMEAYEIDHKR